MGDFILITIAKHGNTQIDRYASADLVEQAWQSADREMRTGNPICLAQYRIDAEGRLGPMRFTWTTDQRKTRSIVRRLAAIRKGFQAAV